MATAYTLLKQTQRAKNQLKRVNKAAWNFEDAEYLERCWLLLADYYIQSNKYEIARELINKVITYNKSCNKAYEYLGQIDEKEQHYKEAVQHYDQAWKYGGKYSIFALIFKCFVPQMENIVSVDSRYINCVWMSLKYYFGNVLYVIVNSFNCILKSHFHTPKTLYRSSVSVLLMSPVCAIANGVLVFCGNFKFH